ncbi:MAG: YihY/virulence factor BrkB family protein [Rhodospirillaceae bacterium]
MASTDLPVQEKAAVSISFGILRKEWLSVARAVWKEVKEDNLSLVSAGAGFYALLAVIPAIGAIVSLYGLKADAETIREHLGFVRSALPREASQLLADQVRALTPGEDVKLGFGFVIGLALSLWSASRAVIALLTVVNIAYEEAETRSFIVINLLAILDGFPAAVNKMHLPDWLVWLILLLRWPPLAVLVLAGLAFFYRFGPNRRRAPMQWLTPGAVLAMLFWVIAAAGFSAYVSNFGKYNETFGSLAAGIILPLWFYVCAYVVCVGAEINAELEFRARRSGVSPHCT